MLYLFVVRSRTINCRIFAFCTGISRQNFISSLFDRKYRSRIYLPIYLLPSHASTLLPQAVGCSYLDGKLRICKPTIAKLKVQVIQTNSFKLSIKWLLI
jgi:hypothetical protein